MFWYIISISLAALIISFFGCKFLIAILSKKKIFDHPNIRSSHSSAIPIGAGIVVISIILFFLFSYTLVHYLIFDNFLFSNLGIFIALLSLTIISWKDDLIQLSAFYRLVFHFFAASIGVSCLSEPGIVFQGILPVYLDTAVTILLWVWIINLTNFMDGIDGMTGTQSIFIFFGSFLIILLFGKSVELSNNFFILAFLSIITCSIIGFLLWNWYPAKIFLGDVGSIPIGFLLGWIIFELATMEIWHASILLPMYYFFDTTLTLINRIVKKEKIFEAHRSHFYQKACNFNKHSKIVFFISILNTILLLITILVFIYSETKFILVLLGAFLTLITLLFFQKISKRYE